MTGYEGGVGRVAPPRNPSRNAAPTPSAVAAELGLRWTTESRTWDALLELARLAYWVRRPTPLCADQVAQRLTAGSR